MFTVSSWFRTARDAEGDLARAEAAHRDTALDLKEVLGAFNNVFDDNIEQAEKELALGNSSFHKMGRGLMILLESSLGFEKKIIKDAATILADAEASSKVDQQNEVGRRIPNKDSIYPAGTEFALCHAQTQLSIAIVAVLNERMSEYIRGLYKIRQGYMLLKSILDNEKKHMSGKAGFTPTQLAKRETLSREKAAAERVGDTSSYSTFAEVPFSEEDKIKAGLITDDEGLLPWEADATIPVLKTAGDVYVYTGSNLCFGVLLVVLSMVPSAFQQILKIIGFRGDKERGMDMLWKTTKFRNIHGALAALILLSFYNAIRSACDILDGESYPKAKCEKLINQMTTRYPRSVFWMLEEARIAVAHNDLEKGIRILERPIVNPVKQLVALNLMEKSMYRMLIHEYEVCCQGFVESVALHKYSHALYYYNAGCAQVELYRCSLMDNSIDKAAVHKKKAAELLDTAINGVDKKQLMATELPFDTFVTRKINKWQQRADEKGIDLVDAVGVSPLEEMIYYYGGHKWMQPHHIEQSLKMLTWSENSPHWKDEAFDEHCIHSLLKAVVHRQSGKLIEAKSHLALVLKQDWKSFKGKLLDNWTMPSAHYEMAIICWMERKDPGVIEADKVNECQSWLDKIAKWERYELDDRITLKVKAAQDVVTAYNKRAKGL